MNTEENAPQSRHIEAQSCHIMNTEKKLLSAYEDIVWMAIRYAHGRSTYAPSMVRQSIKKIQEIYPHWKPEKDHVICPRDLKKQLDETPMSDK